MFKLILCILITLCSTAIGFSCSSVLYTRKHTLESFLLELKNSKTVIRYNSNSLSKVFSSSFTDYSFCDNKPFCIQWEEMLNNYTKVLSKEDIEILLRFGQNIGTTDLSGELNCIDMYITLIESQINEAQSVIDAKSKVYRTLGLSLGLSIAIILI